MFGEDGGDAAGYGSAGGSPANERKKNRQVATRRSHAKKTGYCVHCHCTEASTFRCIVTHHPEHGHYCNSCAMHLRNNGMLPAIEALVSAVLVCSRSVLCYLLILSIHSRWC